jgi:hypothetical protein
LGSWIHVPSFIIELAYLADLLQSRSFGFAGTKDKRAVTTQQVRIPQVYDKTIVICSSLIWPWSFFKKNKPWSSILAEIWKETFCWF